MIAIFSAEKAKLESINNRDIEKIKTHIDNISSNILNQCKRGSYVATFNRTSNIGKQDTYSSVYAVNLFKKAGYILKYDSGNGKTLVSISWKHTANFKDVLKGIIDKGIYEKKNSVIIDTPITSTVPFYVIKQAIDDAVNDGIVTARTILKDDTISLDIKTKKIKTKTITIDIDGKRVTGLFKENKHGVYISSELSMFYNPLENPLSKSCGTIPDLTRDCEYFSIKNYTILSIENNYV